MTQLRRVAAVALAAGAALTLSGIAHRGGAVAQATDIKVLSAVVMKSALDDLAREFERTTGQKIAIAYAPAGSISDRIQGGEAFDVTILPRPVIGRLETQGKILPGSAAVLARSAVSVCARAGSPIPAIGSVEAFKGAMLAAKSIAYSDPAKGGASGIHIARVLDRLAISEQMKAKTKLTGPDSAELVARGEAELCVAQAMDIMRTVGVVLVGPLPADLQNTTDFVFAAGIAAESRRPEPAKSLISYLRKPDAARVLKAKGMEPGGE
jgi:molybdate transport system substrate-binding protein